jgi:hypothetical protein
VSHFIPSTLYVYSLADLSIINLSYLLQAGNLYLSSILKPIVYLIEVADCDMKVFIALLPACFVS